MSINAFSVKGWKGWRNFGERRSANFAFTQIPEVRLTRFLGRVSNI